MKNRFIGAFAACLLIATSQFAAAQSGSGGLFTLVNDTENNVVVGFYTSEDLEVFSDNWLDDPMMPGESGSAEFFADAGECIQYFVVGWLGSDMDSEVLDEPIEIDICEASIVYLNDNEIYFE